MAYDRDKYVSNDEIDAEAYLTLIENEHTAASIVDELAELVLEHRSGQDKECEHEFCIGVKTFEYIDLLLKQNGLTGAHMVMSIFASRYANLKREAEKKGNK